MKTIVSGLICATTAILATGCQMSVTDNGVVFGPAPLDGYQRPALFEPSRVCRTAYLALGPYSDRGTNYAPTIPNKTRQWNGWSLEPLDGTFVSIDKAARSEQLLLQIRSPYGDPAELESVEYWRVTSRDTAPRKLRCLDWPEYTTGTRRAYRCYLPLKDSDRDGDQWALRSMVVTRAGTRANYGPRFYDSRCDGTYADRYFERDEVRLHGAVSPELNVPDRTRRVPTLSVRL